jgi:thiamine kinase-like enzyme
MHHCLELKQLLPQVLIDSYNMIGLEAQHLKKKWIKFRAFVPQVSNFIDESLALLKEQVTDFQGAGLVASHNDICYANWLILSDGQIYLTDFESMSLEDPAFDIGATLWWYYPPQMRQKFLDITGHANDEEFDSRRQVRMAMHRLNILLPREGSFDSFDAARFAASLTDFRAALVGEENPQGYYN